MGYKEISLSTEKRPNRGVVFYIPSLTKYALIMQTMVGVHNDGYGNVLTLIVLGFGIQIRL